MIHDKEVESDVVATAVVTTSAGPVRERSASLDGRPASQSNCSTTFSSGRNSIDSALRVPETFSRSSVGNGRAQLSIPHRPHYDYYGKTHVSATENEPVNGNGVENMDDLSVRPKTEDFLTFLCFRGKETLNV